MAYKLDEVKILVIDDMAPMIALMKSLLDIFGFKNITFAANGQEGYDLFNQINPDLVITDWQMEPIDGLALIEAIRKDPDSVNQFVPIILMTGYSDKPRVENARDKGVTEFLMKPFSAKDLYARIVQIIEKPRQFVDAGDFFGPDRRRRKNVSYTGGEKRTHRGGNSGRGNGNSMADMDFDLVLANIKQSVDD